MNRKCTPSFFILIFVYLLGSARVWSVGGCECPEIPHRNLTQPPPKNCFNTTDWFRYSCCEGYVRKAGTSNLIKCKKDKDVVYWTPSSLECIPHPHKTQLEKRLMEACLSLLATTSPTGDPPAQTTEGKHRVQVTPQAAKNDTSPTPSTRLPPNLSTGILSAPEYSQGAKVTTVCVSLAAVIIVCSLIGLSFYLCKRRAGRNRPQQREGEMEPMNRDSQT
ncbi:interleukin-15 receptor subunit alpha isoform 2-T2 [Menidia menidia]